MDYTEGIAAIDEALNHLPDALKGEERTVLRKIGTSVKKNVVRLLHESDVETRAKEIRPGNYDGSRPYVHMKDDVKSTVKKDKQGEYYVSIKGGKMTGFKWGPVNNGHIARDGTTFVPGTHFMDRAVQASSGDVDKIVDELLRKMVE